MKKTKNHKATWYLKYLLLTSIVITISACGGGGGGSSGSDGGIIGTGAVHGTAATGDAIANANVTLKSNTGETITTTTDANGKFQADALSSGSFLLRVDQGNNKFLYSMAYSNGSDTVTRNIHPYTDLIIRNWFETQGLDISNAFTSDSASPMPSLEEVNAIKDEIHAIIALGLQDYGVDENTDLFSTPFDADETGFDKFILENRVIINNNQITVIVNSIDLDIQATSINALDLGTDFVTDTDSVPTTPKNVRALPENATNVIVVWEASSDDKGIAGYRIYRNGEFITSTPYPVYQDTGLTPATEYYYEIEAFDGRNQVSTKSDSTPTIVLDTADTTAPEVPTGLQVTANENFAMLSWTQTQINDVYGFRILRGSANNVSTEIANVTATQYADFNLVSATEYCYKVIAYDAAGNESNASVETCNTTGGVVPEAASVSLSSATYSVSESSSSISIVVQRSGNISDAISVDYSVTNGTAVEGEDFSATSGTLNWAANDSGSKEFAVQISSDALVEGNETVNIALSTPSANTVLGSNTTAILTITDAVTAGCNAEISTRDITEDTTLSEPCYKVLNGISVKNPAKLTVSPGVRLEFAAGTQLYLEQGSSLYAVGTAAQPITFTGHEPSPGYWEGIEFSMSNSIYNQLEHVTVEYGTINIDTFSTSGSPVKISLKNTTLRYASNLGVYIFGTSVQLAAFENNVLTLNGRPILLPSTHVGLLGKDSQYSGNTDDRIHVVNEDIPTQTWQNLGVPYYMRTSSVYDITGALTIEAGTSLIFNSGSTLEATESGSLKAIGTPDKPILFTGLNKSPGYWKGIEFFMSNSIDNQLDYVTIEYAGSGNPATSGNISSFCTAGSPARFSVTNSTIKDSFGWGVYKHKDVAGGCNITLENNTYLNNATGDVNTP